MFKKIYYRLIYIVVSLLNIYLILLLIKPSLYSQYAVRTIFGFLFIVGVYENLKYFLKKQNNN